MKYLKLFEIFFNFPKVGELYKHITKEGVSICELIKIKDDYWCMYKGYYISPESIKGQPTTRFETHFQEKFTPSEEDIEEYYSIINSNKYNL